MNLNNIKKLLAEFDEYKVERYANYCVSVLEAKKKEGQNWVKKNPWMEKRSDIQLADFFKAVVNDGLDFDGKHITLISTGVSYDYIAYKNKMLLVYPETLFDVQMVYRDDTFKFEKNSGKVIYEHCINNPFGQSENDLKGGYCIIKNSMGEFLTLLTVAEFEKHRKVAKTDAIWKIWYIEMCLKTLIKKACKFHFDDIFQTIEKLDNEQNDLENSLEISIETKQQLEIINTVPDLEKYYRKNKGANAGIIADFNKACASRKEAIVKALVEESEECEPVTKELAEKLEEGIKEDLLEEKAIFKGLD